MRKMADIVRNQDPLTLPPSATVREACRCMRDRRVGAVLVTESEHRLVGIFTGRDAVHRVLAEGKSAARTTLAEVMTGDPDTMPPGKTAIEALRLMEGGRYRHVPIVDGDRSWESFRVSISAVSNWIASTRRPACGSGFDGGGACPAVREPLLNCLDTHQRGSKCLLDLDQCLAGRFAFFTLAERDMPGWPGSSRLSG
jgi:CBS domain-containing protein